MSENKKRVKTEKGSKKNEVKIKKKKTASINKSSKKTSALSPATSSDLWQAFDDTFLRFRNDFEDILFPANWFDTYNLIPETRVPVLDLEDRGKDYLLKVEMPGFKKEEIEIEVQEDSIAVTGSAGWTYDKKAQDYICKERACEVFYRMVDLPEDVKEDKVTANLSDGVLEVILPKKAPKQKRKVAIK